MRPTTEGDCEAILQLWRAAGTVDGTTPASKVPAGVLDSKRLAERLGFSFSCSDEVGRLLATLATSIPQHGRILELGTGAGVGTAWLCYGLGARADAEIVTVELDEALVAEVRNRAWPASVRFVVGDAVAELGALGLFDLVFADAPGGKWERLDLTLAAVGVGGRVLVDDMTPQPEWPPEQRVQQAAVCRSLVSDPRFTAVEMAWGGGVILAARRPDRR
jgi:demethylmenaquinone methyltransferase/2-methoxy-6-polyprenyl-1,4-benzoquinol methylase